MHRLEVITPLAIRKTYNRGDIYYADLSPVVGSEQGGTRPVLVIQNDIGNFHSPTVIIAAITTRFTKAKIPTHIELKSGKAGLERDSVIMLEQIRTIDKKRLTEKVSQLNSWTMKQVDLALCVSLAVKIEIQYEVKKEKKYIVNGSKK